MSSTFLVSPAMAEDFAVTAGYLNSLTSPKITWSDSDNGGTAVNINGQDFYYTYHAPSDYTEATSRITGNFTSEDVYHKLFTDLSGNSQGGAIYSLASGVSGVSIISDFVNNSTSATGSTTAYGGAIHVTGPADIAELTGAFVGNHSTATAGNVVGGFIYSYSSSAANASTIDSINGNFVNNWSQSSGAEGKFIHSGVIDNHGIINNIDANFIGNRAISPLSNITGTAINNMPLSGQFDSSGVIGSIQGDFVGNSAQSDSGYVQGGAVFNTGAIGDIVNSNFLYNTVAGNSDSGGGAIYSNKNLNVSADGGTSLFEGNIVNGESNAIYMSGTSSATVDLNLRAENGGTMTFNDDIDGQYYNINVLGDGSGEVAFNQNVENFDNIAIQENGVMRMGINSEIKGGNVDWVADNQTIKVDIEVDRANKTTKSGLITLTGNVKGDYKVIVNSLNTQGYEGANTMFLTAPDDETAEDENFTVSRVIGSPYEWGAFRNYGGETDGSNWYLALTKYETPEVVAAVGLHQAAIEQTRSVVRNVSNKVGAGREYCPNCGVYDYNWDGEKLRNLWILVNGENAQIDKHIDMEAKIWGVEAGFDVQKDPCNTLGVFASYRRGDYDLSGDGDKYRSTIGSDIDIDSYLAGLYYRYDRNMNWLFATIYGGVQKAEIKTDDGVSNFDTDGIELGAGVEVGRTIPLNDSVTLTPSFSLYYNQVNYDEAEDNVGKRYDWSEIRHVEAEAGVRLEKQFERGKIYIKPSIIRTLTGNDKVKITGMGEADTYHDQTLGRIEVGGRYGFTDAFSGYAWGNYTFGSDYKATGAGAGVSYAW